MIASGGAGTLEHFKEALTEGGADAALAASLFHYKELEIREVKEYLRKEGSRSDCREGLKQKRKEESHGGINGDWYEALKGEFKKPYYRKLFDTVNEEYRTQQIFPPAAGYF